MTLRGSCALVLMLAGALFTPALAGRWRCAPRAEAQLPLLQRTAPSRAALRRQGALWWRATGTSTAQFRLLVELCVSRRAAAGRALKVRT